MEELNIEADHLGSGIVVPKAALVSALSRALAEKVMLMDFTIGRKEFITHLRFLCDSDLVEIVPILNGDASRLGFTGRRLKVVCGNNTAYLKHGAWAGGKKPTSLCSVRIGPNNKIIKPNLQAQELGRALSRVLPFTAKDDRRSILRCVLFRVQDGKLTLMSTDSIKLAVARLDCDGEPGQILVDRDEFTGISDALRKTHCVNLSIRKEGPGTNGMRLVVDTELTTHEWTGVNAKYPWWEHLIPNVFNASATFTPSEGIRALTFLKALSCGEYYAVDLTVGKGKITMSTSDGNGTVGILADTYGECRITLCCRHVIDVLRACGGTVVLKLADASTPASFAADGCEFLIRPILPSVANELRTDALTITHNRRGEKARLKKPN